jgi:hypothetical protein
MIEIRPATEADKDQILARMDEVYGEAVAQRAQRLWHWQWHLDPRLPAAGYRGLVATWRGEVIGNLATLPAGLHIGGQPVQAWWFADVLVHWGRARQALRQHRRQGRARDQGRDSSTQPDAPLPAAGADLSRGIAGALFDHPAAGPIQLGKHIADAMAAIGARLGFDVIQDTGSLQRRVSTAHRLGRVIGRPAGDLAAAMMDLALPRCPRPQLAVEPLEGRFDARFDALWARLKAAYPAICRRDSALLNWRYLDYPDGGHRVLTLADQQQLRGYCVLRAFDRGPRRRGKLLDLLTAPDDQEARAALLAAALCELRRLRVERVECFYSDLGVAQLLSGMGFRPGNARHQRPQALMARHLPAAAIGLYVTQGDGDGG